MDIHDEQLDREGSVLLQQPPDDAEIRDGGLSSITAKPWGGYGQPYNNLDAYGMKLKIMAVWVSQNAPINPQWRPQPNICLLSLGTARRQLRSDMHAGNNS